MDSYLLLVSISLRSHGEALRLPFEPNITTVCHPTTAGCPAVSHTSQRSLWTLLVRYCAKSMTRASVQRKQWWVACWQGSWPKNTCRGSSRSAAPQRFHDFYLPMLWYFSGTYEHIEDIELPRSGIGTGASMIYLDVYLRYKWSQKRCINPSAQKKGTEAFCRSPECPHWKIHWNQNIKGGNNIRIW